MKNEKKNSAPLASKEDLMEVIQDSLDQLDSFPLGFLSQERLNTIALHLQDALGVVKEGV